MTRFVASYSSEWLTSRSWTSPVCLDALSCNSVRRSFLAITLDIPLRFAVWPLAMEREPGIPWDIILRVM